MRQINSITANTGMALSSLSFIGVIFLIIVIVTFVKVSAIPKYNKKIKEHFEKPSHTESAHLVGDSVQLRGINIHQTERHTMPVSTELETANDF